MRTAKKELHKAIIDTMLKFNPSDEELNELLDYVKNLAEIEKTY